MTNRRKIINRRNIASLLFLTIGVLIVNSITLYTQDFLFDCKVHSVLDKFGRITPQATSGDDALRALPELVPTTKAEDTYWCPPDAQCFAMYSHLPDFDRSYRFIAWVSEKLHTDRPVGFALYALGFRSRWLSEQLAIRNGKVEHWEVRFDVSTREPNPPGTVEVQVINTTKIRPRYYQQTLDEEEPEFRRTYRYANLNDSWPTVIITSKTDAALKKAALDVDLGCMYTWRGCETGMQMIPGAAEAEVRLEQAAKARIASGNPCPERIVRRRAADAKAIILGEVVSVIGEFGNRYVQFKNMQTLKGDAKIEDQKVEIYDGGWAYQTMDLPLERTKPFLRPGSGVLLLLTDVPTVDESCGTLPRTDDNLKIIRSAIAEQLPHE